MATIFKKDSPRQDQIKLNSKDFKIAQDVRRFYLGSQKCAILLQFPIRGGGYKLEPRADFSFLSLLDLRIFNRFKLIVTFRQSSFSSSLEQSLTLQLKKFTL